MVNMAISTTAFSYLISYQTGKGNLDAIVHRAPWWNSRRCQSNRCSPSSSLIFVSAVDTARRRYPQSHQCCPITGSHHNVATCGMDSAFDRRVIFGQQVKNTEPVAITRDEEGNLLGRVIGRSRSRRAITNQLLEGMRHDGMCRHRVIKCGPYQGRRQEMGRGLSIHFLDCGSYHIKEVGPSDMSLCP
jgi:hypothetical protein